MVCEMVAGKRSNNSSFSFFSCSAICIDLDHGKVIFNRKRRKDYTITKV